MRPIALNEDICFVCLDTFEDQASWCLSCADHGCKAKCHHSCGKDFLRNTQVCGICRREVAPVLSSELGHLQKKISQLDREISSSGQVICELKAEMQTLTKAIDTLTPLTGAITQLWLEFARVKQEAASAFLQIAQAQVGCLAAITARHPS